MQDRVCSAVVDLTRSPSPVACSQQQQPTQGRHADDVRQCPICLCELPVSGGASTELPACGHAFCSACLLEWARSQQAHLRDRTEPTCPVCRAPFALDVFPEADARRCAEAGKRGRRAARQQAREVRHCLLCAEDLGEVPEADRYVLGACHHAFCRPCLRQHAVRHVKCNLGSGATCVRSVPCPACPQRFQAASDLVPSAELARWRRQESPRPSSTAPSPANLRLLAVPRQRRRQTRPHAPRRQPPPPPPPDSVSGSPLREGVPPPPPAAAVRRGPRRRLMPQALRRERAFVNAGVSAAMPGVTVIDEPPHLYDRSGSPPSAEHALASSQAPIACTLCGEDVPVCYLRRHFVRDHKISSVPAMLKLVPNHLKPYFSCRRRRTAPRRGGPRPRLHLA